MNHPRHHEPVKIVRRLIILESFAVHRYNENMQRTSSEQLAHSLQAGDIASWTHLARQKNQNLELVVTNITQTPAPHGTRYTLTLKQHSDPITLIAQKTTAQEARFYAQLSSPQTPLLVPCWFSHVKGKTGWIILEELPSPRSPFAWQGSDALEMMTELAMWHADYWDDTTFFRHHRWLPYYLGNTRNRLNLFPPKTEAQLSWQALQTTQNLAPRWLQVKEAMTLLFEVEGWLGVIDERHLRAAADLIDDPLPLFHTLRQLPMSVLHGYAGIYNWRATGWAGVRLLEWGHVSIGPSILDLVAYLETFDLLMDGRGNWTLREEQLVSEETLIDTYLLTLSAELGKACNSHELRRAIPAARCLHTLLHWFPRLHFWISQLPTEPELRHELWHNLSDDTLSEDSEGRPAIAPLRQHLTLTFHRFLRSYYQL